jgi:hypothetical protein
VATRSHYLVGFLDAVRAREADEPSDCRDAHTTDRLAANLYEDMAMAMAEQFWFHPGSAPGPLMSQSFPTQKRNGMEPCRSISGFGV